MTPSSALPDSTLLGSVVVGVDGSADSEPAIDWAARQADLEHRPLVLAHACGVSVGGMPWALRRAAGPDDVAEEIALVGRTLLEVAERRARRRSPTLEVHLLLETERDARHLLLGLGAHASSVVVGSRGRGPLTRVLLGSVSAAVTRHAVCPVVVVRRPVDAPTGSGVVVEVSGATTGRAAVDHAFRTAELRGWEVTLVRTVWVPGHLGAQTGDVGAGVRGLDEERASLAEVTTRMATEHPDVPVRTRLVNGVREHVLVQVSRDADLLVLGSRRLSSLDDMLQSSSVVTVVEHAACDVVVVPDPAHAADATDATDSAGVEVLQEHVPAQA